MAEHVRALIPRCPSGNQSGPAGFEGVVLTILVWINKCDRHAETKCSLPRAQVSLKRPPKKRSTQHDLASVPCLALQKRRSGWRLLARRTLTHAPADTPPYHRKSKPHCKTA